VVRKIDLGFDEAPLSGEDQKRRDRLRKSVPDLVRELEHFEKVVIPQGVERFQKEYKTAHTALTAEAKKAKEQAEAWEAEAKRHRYNYMAEVRISAAYEQQLRVAGIVPKQPPTEYKTTTLSTSDGTEITLDWPKNLMK
jgi:hypothetical protein